MQAGLQGLFAVRRSKCKILTTGEFVEAIRDCIPARGEQKYLAMVFQALRIEVNDELGVIEADAGTNRRLYEQGGPDW